MILQREIEDLFGLHGELLDNYNKPAGIYTLEQPWRENRHDVSCIPAGDYYCSAFMSEHLKGSLYRVDNVPNRGGVLIHGGNFLKDTRGCILVGLAKDAHGDLGKSQDALVYLSSLVPSAGFRLRIRSVGDLNREAFI